MTADAAHAWKQWHEVGGVRDFDPAAPAREALRGIEATPRDPRWSVPGRFTPYDEDRAVRVETRTDGRAAWASAGSRPSPRPGRS
jgi:uncharacterized protein (DUF1684 family)